MSDPASFPLVGGAWFDPRGNPTQETLAFFRALWQRTGGGVGGASPEDAMLLSVLGQGGAARFDPIARAQAEDAMLVAILAGGARRPSTSVQTGVQAATPSEALNAGDLVNVYLSGGVMSVRQANAADPARFANGFVLVSASIGVPVVIYPTGAFNSAATVATGQGEVWLSDVTPGAFSLTPPTTTGHLLQTVGAAYQGAGLAFVQGDYTIL